MTTYDCPAAWRASSFSSPEVWSYHLSAEDVAELKSAVDAHDTDSLPSLTKADFPLPRLSAVLEKIRSDLLFGRGFSVVKGIPVDLWDIATTTKAFWALGTHLGSGVPQNAAGHLVGHVFDLGADANDPSTRIYTTSAAQPFHTDSADVVGLLCVRPAKEGGRSSFCSSVEVYNALAAKDPAMAEAMAAPFPVDRKGEVPAGQKGWYELAVFHKHEDGDGRPLLSSIFDPSFIHASQRHADAPRLSDLQRKSLHVAEELAASDALRLDMWLEPGDVQFLHNHTIWHMRTAYKHDPDAPRHLLRLWLAPDDARPLPDAFCARFGTVQAGARGGIRVPGQQLTVPLSPS